MTSRLGMYEKPESRWAGLGPYYAMFPVGFADHVIKKYTSVGDTVLDPFAGRGTAIYSAATKGRHAAGIELNPVGWVYAQTKLRPAEEVHVLERVREIGQLSKQLKTKPTLPVFFSWCFSEPVQKFLITARDHLNWRQSNVDRTLMALLLVNMHGKREASLSNQMRQTKSMSPDYAVSWWRERNLEPPKVDPVEFMERRIKWRYAKGLPATNRSFVYLGDSTKRLPDIHKRSQLLCFPKTNLLLTSPPYLGITNYHYDQWLRLWLLGGLPSAGTVTGDHKGKFSDRTKYRRLLFDVFNGAKPLLAKDAVVYVRTDYRELTLQITTEVLAQVFPNKRMFRRKRDINKPTQTHLFRNKIEKSAEVDLVLLP